MHKKTDITYFFQLCLGEDGEDEEGGAEQDEGNEHYNGYTTEDTVQRILETHHSPVIEPVLHMESRLQDYRNNTLAHSTIEPVLYMESRLQDYHNNTLAHSTIEPVLYMESRLQDYHNNTLAHSTIEPVLYMESIKITRLSCGALGTYSFLIFKK